MYRIYNIYSDGVSKAWIGMLTNGDPDKAERYKWVSTGQNPRYNAWGEGEPNNCLDFGPEKCVEMGAVEKNWNNVACGMSLPFICEIYL